MEGEPHDRPSTEWDVKANQDRGSSTDGTTSRLKGGEEISTEDFNQTTSRTRTGRTTCPPASINDSGTATSQAVLSGTTHAPSLPGTTSNGQNAPNQKKPYEKPISKSQLQQNNMPFFRTVEGEFT